MAEYNIGQFTEESDFSIIRKQLPIQIPDNTYPAGGYLKNFQIWYRVIRQNTFGKNIVKLGYCCEPAAQYFPIGINANGSTEINMYVGKEGMLEYQDIELLPNSNKYIYLPICFLDDPTATNPQRPDQKFKQTLDFVLEM